MSTSASRASARPHVLPALGAAAILSFAACADEWDPIAEDPLGAIAAASIDGGVVVASDVDAGSDADVEPDAGDAGARDPKSAFFAEVTANGTGCPAGTWETRLSSDGRSFLTTFSAFEAEVGRSSTVSIKDCQVGIRLHSPEAVSYAVEGASFGGYLYLEEGVQARIQSTYYFSGYPTEGASHTTDFNGPQDRDFLFTDEFSPLNLVRSRCSNDQLLNVRLTARLLNASPRSSGYVSIDRFPASHRMGVRLTWKRCSE